MAHDRSDHDHPDAASARPRPGWSRGQVAAVAVVVLVILVSGVVLARSLGGPSGSTVVTDAPTELRAVGPSTSPTTAGTTSTPPDTEAPPPVTAPPSTAASTTQAPAPTTPPPPPPPPPRSLGRVSLIGDSVAVSLTPGLQAHAGAVGIPFGSAAVSGCGIVTGVTAFPDGTPVAGVEGCERVVVELQRGLAARDGASTVVAMSTWETADRWVDGRFYRFGTPEADALLLRLLAEAKDRILAGSDALFVVTLQPPNAPSPSGSPSPDSVNRMLHLQYLLRAFAAAHPADTRVVDMASMVCPGGPPCPVEVEGVVPRPTDGAHYSAEGAAWLAPKVWTALAAAVA
jgi:hypothetical protein